MGYPNVIFVEEEEGGQVGVGRAHLDEAPKHAAAVTIITLGAAARVGVALAGDEGQEGERGEGERQGRGFREGARWGRHLAGDEGQLGRARLLRVLQGPHLPS